jgi:polyisoprenyl-phosphate glycosyltransferase
MEWTDVTQRPRFSIVIPMFNEQESLPDLFDRLDALMTRIGDETEVVLVDDGSRDRSSELAGERARRDPRYRYIGLSRNFGQQIAITAGMERARGAAIIVMDADLQDPPETVLDLIARWREGYEIVHARRRSRAGEAPLKKITAKVYYRFLRMLSDVDIPADVGDFRLIDRKVAETFKRMPERDRYVRGMFGWMGYRQTIVEFDRDERAQGTTHYSWGRMIRLAIDGLISFSDVPLRLALWIGATVSLGALLYGAYVIAMAVADVKLVSGWASLAVLVSLLSGINLLMTGIVGIYVGRTHREMKQRPLYIVARDTGTPLSSAEAHAVAHELASPR